MSSPHAVFGETQSSQTSSPSIPTSTTVLPTSAIPIKRKRIRFNKTLNYLLLQSVAAAGAHAAPYGEGGKRYDRAAVVFWELVGGKTRADTLPPTAKTIRDRFTTVMDQRRKDIKATSAASGIVEEREAREVLADDLLLEIDEWIEIEVIDLDGCLSSAPSSARKLCKKRSFVVQNSEEDERESFFKGMSEKEERDNKRLKMEEDKLRRETWAVTLLKRPTSQHTFPAGWLSISFGSISTTTHRRMGVIYHKDWNVSGAPHSGAGTGNTPVGRASCVFLSSTG